MKSKFFTRISFCLLAATAVGSTLAIGGFYEPDPKVVTTEEKINHYLFYLANHGLMSVTQSGFKKALPDLVERVVVDGARMVVPDLLGVKTLGQKRLVYYGIDGVRQAVKFAEMRKQYAQERGFKVKKSDEIKYFLTKQFLPSFAKNLVVDLMYRGGSQLAHPLLERIGFNPNELAANPYSISGLIYEQVRGSGFQACHMIYDFLFSRKS